MALSELQESQALPDAYKDNVVHRLINCLIHHLQKDQFDKIFSTHPEDLSEEKEKNIHFCLPILVEALLQRGYESRYDRPAFEDLLAFQGIINTIYNIAIDHMAIPTPPLVAWNKKHKGPFTITEEKIQKTFEEYAEKISVGVVCLPPKYRTRGLFAWSVMGHEVAGHHLIQSKVGLLDELTKSVKAAIENKLEPRLKKEGITYKEEHLACLKEYWSMPKRVEELASDILGVLSTGPSIAIGIIGYLRGQSQDRLLKTAGPFETKKRRPVLHVFYESEIDLQIKSVSKKMKIKKPQGILGEINGKKVQYKAYKIFSDEHPIEALRPFLMAETVNQTALDKKSKTQWIKLITDEITSKEFSKKPSISIIKQNRESFPPEREEIVIPFDVARLSTEVIANAITTRKFNALGKKKLTEIFNWSSSDEALVESVRSSYKNNKPIPGSASSNHIVAAAVIEASIANADIGNLFRIMKQCLVQTLQKA